MVRKYSQKVTDKKEALRNDCVEVKRSDFCFPNMKVNKAIMRMSKDSLDRSAKEAGITVHYYNDDQYLVECAMQTCGDIYVTTYDVGYKPKETICVNPNCKEGVLLTADDIENLSASDKRTLFAKRIASQSQALWKGYVEGKYPTNNEKNMVEFLRQSDGRV